MLYAAAKGHLDVVEMMLAKGALSSSMDSIDVAASNGHHEIVKLIMTKIELKQLELFRVFYGHHEIVEQTYLLLEQSNIMSNQR